MSESFESTVTKQLTEIREELKEHGEALARIDQKELNGEKQEAKEEKAKEHKVLLYRAFMGLGVLIIALFTALDKLGYI